MVRPHARALTPSGRVVIALMVAAVVAVSGLLPAASDPLRASTRAATAHPVAPLVVGPGAAAHPVAGRPSGVVDDREQGLVYRGLGDSTRCRGGFEVLDGEAGVVCTHGPDGASHDDGHGAGGAAAGVSPVGVDVRRERSTAELYQAAGTTPSAATVAAAGAVPCYGDGTTGPRVQAIYAVAADQVDRYASVAPLIASTYAARADAVYDASAARDGGVRHVRWVTTPDCAVDVMHVVLSATGDDSFGNTRTELVNLGLTRSDRKYLVWVDATVYCGIANVTVDDRAGAANAANRGPTFGRVDGGCWGFTNAVEAHELAHTLGAVQLGAPHSNGSWHCTDESDRMCYDDGSGATLTYTCPSQAEAVFDCNGNDYFSVDPVAGSWLAGHWNLADSVFLATALPAPTASPTDTPSATPSVTPTETPSTTPSSTPTGSPTATPTATPSPTPTPTSTTGARGHRHQRVYVGRLTPDHRTRAFLVRATQGRVVAVVHFHRAPQLHVRLERNLGKVVGHRFGPNVLRLVHHLRRDGTIRVVVHGRPTHFRLRLVYRH